MVKIGDVLVAFEFEDTDLLSYHDDMIELIGQGGIVFDIDVNSVGCKFEDGSTWWYPLNKITKTYDQKQIITPRNKSNK